VVGECGSVVAIDIALASLRRSRRRAGEYELAAAFVGGDAVRLPFAADTFDAITCSLMAHHLPDRAKTALFAELRRVLRGPDPASGRPGGRLVFYDLTRPETFGEWFRVWAILSLDLLFEWDRAFANLRGQLPGLIRQAGFRIEREEAWPLRGVRASFFVARKTQSPSRPE
jgi:SAM-dependent methyltransferase